MRSIICSIFVSTLILTAGCQDSADLDSSPEYRSTLDSVSYSLGYFYGSSMANEGIDEFNYSNFVSGLRTAIEQEDPGLDEMEMQMAMQNFQMELQQRQSVENEERASANQEESERFLEENAEREDVQVTESGLQYRVIEEGNGESPGPESNVQVHYRGTLADGEEFDSSYSRGEPAEFPLNQVIPGWTEGLQLMEEGASYEFFIPSHLGYGSNPPSGSPIEPGAVLIFEVELLSVLD
ncbi:MAG: FKBP-type peptidyl-prolyl cis-trans isomerase [Balneolaceae bacterium]